MTRQWLLDTNLVVDWCLWHLAEDTQHEGIAKRATQRLRVMKDRTIVETFERHLRGASVSLAQPTLLEVGGCLWRILSSAHSGTEDRLNKPILRVGLRFLERFGAELLPVREQALNQDAVREQDYGDAIVIGALGQGRRLLTADKRLWLWCRNRKLSAAHFVDGDFNDS